MDCRTALEILEIARPDSDDLKDPELAAAAEHVGSCPQCEASFRSRQELDREIGRLMRDVPVPAGLKQQLLQQLVDESGESGNQESPGDTVDSQLSTLDSQLSAGRRRRFHVAWASAVCLFAAVVVWQVMIRQKTPAVSIADLQTSTTALAAVSKMISNPEQLADFDDSFVVLAPAGWQERVSFSGSGKGFQPEGLASRTLALYRFNLATRRKVAAGGVLLVVPTKWVKSPPAATSFGMAAGKVRYVRAAGSLCATVAWTEGEMVYICFVTAGSLETLERALRVSPV